jgi:hypothetical protein
MILVMKLKITKNGKKFPRSEKNSHGQKEFSMLRTNFSIFGKKFPRSKKISTASRAVNRPNPTLPMVNRAVSRLGPNLT